MSPISLMVSDFDRMTGMDGLGLVYRKPRILKALAELHLMGQFARRVGLSTAHLFP